MNKLTKQLEALIGKLIPSLNSVDQKALAIECAEAVLPIWEAMYPDDQRPRKAIEAAKSVVNNADDVTIVASYAAEASSWDAAYDAIALGADGIHVSVNAAVDAAAAASVAADAAAYAAHANASVAADAVAYYSNNAAIFAAFAVAYKPEYIAKLEAILNKYTSNHY